ncbi:hypothetical protein CXB35_27710 [Pseudomonas syringae]|nr:hypothetical protein CXB35_27710 [Pseudomonas syringae]
MGATGAAIRIVRERVAVFSENASSERPPSRTSPLLHTHYCYRVKQAHIVSCPVGQLIALLG